ncbi:WhiB family transcriptional regulator, partial [Mycobacterium marinum]|uniref:WhiB family transcriptional regulator n=2 Tax=Mycobacterium marinum TaxID=1781 RepID=UPI0015E1B81F
MNHKQLASYIQPPCLQHPADWVNPKRHAWTAHQCRSCSSLQVCAGSALRHRPSYGMWAGVWINGDFTAKQHLLGRQHPDPDPGLESELIEVQPDPPPPLPPAPR